jgi:hypothetical protein
MPAKAPTTEPIMVALVALPVLDDLADPAEAGTLDCAELAVVVAAPTSDDIDDVAPAGVDVAGGENSGAPEFDVLLKTDEDEDGEFVTVAKEVGGNEASDVVAVFVGCDEDELGGAVVVGLVGTLGRTLATIGATSPEAWFKTLTHIAAALVYQTRY